MASVTTRIQIASQPLFIPKFMVVDTTINSTTDNINEIVNEIDLSTFNFEENPDVEIFYARARHENVDGKEDRYSQWSEPRKIFKTNIIERYVAGMYLDSVPGSNGLFIYTWRRIDLKGNRLPLNKWDAKNHWIFKDNFQEVELIHNYRGHVEVRNYSDEKEGFRATRANNVRQVPSTTDIENPDIIENYIRFKPLYYAIYPEGLPDSHSTGKFTVFLSAAPVTSGPIVTTAFPCFYPNGCVDRTNDHTTNVTKAPRAILIGKYPSKILSLAKDRDENSFTVFSKAVSVPDSIETTNQTDEYLNDSTSYLKATKYLPTLNNELDINSAYSLSTIYCRLAENGFEEEDKSRVTKYRYSDGLRSKLFFSHHELFMLQFLYLFILANKTDTWGTFDGFSSIWSSLSQDLDTDPSKYLFGLRLTEEPFYCLGLKMKNWVNKKDGLVKEMIIEEKRLGENNVENHLPCFTGPYHGLEANDVEGYPLQVIPTPGFVPYFYDLDPKDTNAPKYPVNLIGGGWDNPKATAKYPPRSNILNLKSGAKWTRISREKNGIATTDQNRWLIPLAFGYNTYNQSIINSKNYFLNPFCITWYDYMQDDLPVNLNGGTKFNLRKVIFEKYPTDDYHVDQNYKVPDGTHWPYKIRVNEPDPIILKVTNRW